MIQLQYEIKDGKHLLTFLCNKDVLRHLKCKCDDEIVFLQSIHNPYYLTIGKAEDGYRIKRYPYMKKTYYATRSHPLDMIPAFNFRECNYFLKRNGLIQIRLSKGILGEA